MSEMRLDQILEGLGDDERDLLLDVLASTVPSRAVAEKLTEHGYPVGEASVRRWRQRQ